MSGEEARFVADDGLPCGEVGSWTETKHRLVSLYAELFSSGMKYKWNRRVYLELYAGAGRSRIRGTSKLIEGSPVRALRVKQPFDKYVFCEEKPENLYALEKRVQSVGNANVAYVPGDCNFRVDDILTEIPLGSRGDTVLTLCFADPFDISLKFKTLESLSRSRFMDFVVLLAVHSDAGRAYKRYLMEDSVKVDEFLGSKLWRDRWKVAESDGVAFPKFLAEEFAGSMECLNYLPTPIHRMKLVRSDEKNLPLYFVALFSKNKLAHELWDDVLKYSTEQTSLWD